MGYGFIKQYGFAKQQGLTLIELLVSMFITSIIFAGVINTFLTTKQSYLFDAEVSYMQENARFAVDTIARDLRQAGYSGGCNMNGADVANAVDISTSQADFLKTTAVEGFQLADHPDEYKDDVWAMVSSPDSMIIRYSSDVNNITVTSHNAASAEIDVTSTGDLEAGSIFMLAHINCSQIGIAAAYEISTGKVDHSKGSGVDSSSTNCSKHMGGHFNCSVACDSDGNCPGAPNSSAYTYPPGSGVYEFVSKAYYIGTSSADDAVPALFVKKLDSDGDVSIAEELVSGVEDFQILYGVDTQALSADGKVNRYLTSANITQDVADAGSGWIGWDRVLSVRLQLVARSRDPVLQQTTSQTPIAGGVTYNDKYMRQLITTTVQLRNAALAANI
ncbi:MAG: PilW family protein [Oceanicoccus sp.]|uniref:PilW family protein n=1 Tax=Oceanicoccus sp. TaxID=2691044 RepID=UPI0026129C76|nr:PilW family protein [Oceanicoccus sp.]MDG1773479.1 PilW family protein [Oceanicoccus sp.]